MVICMNSLGQEKAVILRFSDEMRNVRKIATRALMLRGLLNSVSEMIPTVAYGMALCYGGIMVAHHEIHYKYVIRYSKRRQ